MKQIFIKIKKNINIIKHEWKQDTREYSVKLAIYRMASSIFRIIRLKKISTIFLDRKNVIVMEYLKNNYGHVFLKYENSVYINDSIRTNCKTLPIWVCWLDGIDKAPPIVKRCIGSIYEHANGHPVKFLNWTNICEYIEMPQFINEKLLDGKIGFAHYTDILRVMLLEKYGGLWLDATIFCSGDLPEEYFNCNFFSCKSNCVTPGCVSNNRWTTFCLGSCKGNILFRALKEFFFDYWSKESCAIDYLFFDDVIELAQNLLPEIKREIECVPENNIKRDDLILRFNCPWEENVVEDLIKSDTVLFKLGYRENRFLQEKDLRGRITVYSAFINGLF